MNITRITAVAPYICPNTLTIRDAMARLNDVSRREGGRSHQFLVVVGEDGRLFGTLSDGDFRRGIIGGCSADDPVSRCCFRQPLVGRQGEHGENVILLKGLYPQANYLPVLDAAGQVCEILLLDTAQSSSCLALVMAGGFGTRLGERTRNTPKPLLPVGDRPILAHILDRFGPIDPENIYISVHYLAEQIADFVETRPERDRIRLVHETTPLGTAGALGLLPNPLPHPIIVSNGDVLTQLDFSAFWQFYLRHNYDAVIAVAQHTVNIPFGVVQHTIDGRFLHIDEKPTLTHYVNAGIYLLSPQFCALVAPNERIDMTELLKRGQQIGLNVGLFPLHEHWTDVGRPEDLERADQRHRSE